MARTQTFCHFSRNAGIAIGPLIFVIALLGVLAAAIASGSGSFTAGTSAESARLYAAALIEQQHIVFDGVSLLIGRGCDPTQISFENAIVSGYTNSLSPSNHSCHVFDPRGAGVIYSQPPTQALDASLSGKPNYGHPFFTALPSVYRLGNYSTGFVLVMVVPYVNQPVAAQINTSLGITGALENNQICNLSYDAGQKFVGPFGSSSCGATSMYGKNGATVTNVAGKMSGCIYRSDLSAAGFPNYECFAVLSFQ